MATFEEEVQNVRSSSNRPIPGQSLTANPEERAP